MNHNLIKLFLILLSWLSVAASHAATVSGFVTTAQGKAAANSTISITCPNNFSTSTISNKYGRYRSKGLPNVTWCKMTVKFSNKPSNAVKINSGSGSKDINIKLMPENNKWKIVL